MTAAQAVHGLKGVARHNVLRFVDHDLFDAVTVRTQWVDLRSVYDMTVNVWAATYERACREAEAGSVH